MGPAEPRVPASPSPRFGLAMAYDGQRVILFGGVDTSGTFLNDTWAFDANGWTRLAPVAAPPPTAFATMVCDTRQLVLFGGVAASDAQNTTWIFDGITWTLVDTPASPPARSNAGMAYDGKQIVLFGGLSHGSTAFLGDTWIFTGTDWTQVSTSSRPSARRNPSMASLSARAMLFGGTSDAGRRNDSWLFDDEPNPEWTSVWSAVSPPARSGGAMISHSAPEQILLFGGITDEGDRLSDTWARQLDDGSHWRPIRPSTIPPARLGAGIAYDAGRDLVVMFGGSGKTTVLGDTWTFGGGEWTQWMPPPPDPVTLESLVFDGSSYLDLTWLPGGNDPDTGFHVTVTVPGGTLYDLDLGSNDYPGVGPSGALCSRLDLSALPLDVIDGQPTLSLSPVSTGAVGPTGPAATANVYTIRPLVQRTVYQGGTLETGLQYRVTVVNQGYDPRTLPQFVATVLWHGTRVYGPTLLQSAFDANGAVWVMLSLPASLPFFVGSTQIPPGLELEVALAQADAISQGPAGPASALLLTTPQIISVAVSPDTLSVTVSYPPGVPTQSAAQIVVWQGTTLVAQGAISGTTGVVAASFTPGLEYTATSAALAGQSVGPPSPPVNLFSR